MKIICFPAGRRPVGTPPAHLLPAIERGRRATARSQATIRSDAQRLAASLARLRRQAHRMSQAAKALLASAERLRRCGDPVRRPVR